MGGISSYTLTLHEKQEVPIATCPSRKMSLTFQDETRQFVHFAVDGWADQKTPNMPAFLALLRLTDWVLHQHSIDGPHRIVVHCAGGIGRSAVFVAADSMSRAIAAGFERSRISPDTTM